MNHIRKEIIHILITEFMKHLFFNIILKVFVPIIDPIVSVGCTKKLQVNIIVVIYLYSILITVNSLFFQVGQIIFFFVQFLTYQTQGSYLNSNQFRYSILIVWFEINLHVEALCLSCISELRDSRSFAI